MQLNMTKIVLNLIQLITILWQQCGKDIYAFIWLLFKKSNPQTSWKTCCAVADEVLSKLTLIRSHHFSRSLWSHHKDTTTSKENEI